MTIVKNNHRLLQHMNHKIQCLCTCTGIEIITALGVTGYLLYLEEFILGLISTIVFAKLIAFHFIMEYYDKKIQKKSQGLSLKNP